MSDYETKPDTSGKKWTRMEYAEHVAKKRGCVIVLPKANELFIDIDSDEKMEFFYRQRDRLEMVVGAMPFVATPSPSGRPGRYHVVVTMSYDVTNVERLILQAVLGSDLVRERIAFERMVQEEENPVMFFENVT